MFTGIVTDIGVIDLAEDIPAGRRFRILTAYDADTIDIGASIACLGVCHTVVEKGRRDDGQNWFTVESARETLRLTSADRWQQGQRLNLERSLAMGDELGGHLVLGHVDGLAEIIERVDHPDSVYFKFRADRAFTRFIPKKGSVALDGTSLTVNEAEDDTFSVFLIPHTVAVTTWGERQVGSVINLEVDMMARYVARLQEMS